MAPVDDDSLTRVIDQLDKDEIEAVAGVGGQRIGNFHGFGFLTADAVQ